MGKGVIVDLNGYFTQLLDHIKKSKLVIEHNGFKLCHNQCMTFRSNEEDHVYHTIALGIGLCPKLEDIKNIENEELETKECVFITNISTTADAIIIYTDFYYSDSDRYAFSDRIVIVNRDLVVNEIYILSPRYENGKIRYPEEKVDLKRPLSKLWLGVFATRSLA